MGKKTKKQIERERLEEVANRVFADLTASVQFDVAQELAIRRALKQLGVNLLIDDKNKPDE